MKRIWLWLVAATAVFILLLWVWMAVPIDYDFSDAMLSGQLDGPFAYELYMLFGWLLGAVKYLMAAAYALALFAILRRHQRRLLIMLLTGAGTSLSGLLVFIGIMEWNWFYTQWVMPFASALITTGLLIITLAFAFCIFRRPAFEESEGKYVCN